ncbi:MAG: plasmid mobilization relaxosome protein MobC [Clostridia bacterium]|nr:plasmid mobilization relaxosome protein MobC [Clostridia bacterium]
MSEEEKHVLDEKVTASGMNRTDYIIRALSDKPIISITSGNEILAELKRQGNNLNQAVKNNYFGDITEQELLAVVDECKRVYRKLSAAIGGS